jgi:hypothetical protein
MECEFTESALDYASEPMLYFCHMQNPQIFESDNYTIDAIYGDHLAFKGNEDVKALIVISGSKMTSFPVSINNVFPNLLEIDIAHTKISKLTQDDLKPFPQLKYFFFYSNPISHIPGDLFDSNPHLVSIFMHDNPIAHIDSRAFSDLDKLQFLWLSGTNCGMLKNADNRTEVEKMVKIIEDRECTLTTTTRAATSMTTTAQNESALEDTTEYDRQVGNLEPIQNPMSEIQILSEDIDDKFEKFEVFLMLLKNQNEKLVMSVEKLTAEIAELTKSHVNCQTNLK